MVIKFVRLTSDDRKIELTLTTNNVAHSILSDNPELKTDIEEAVNTEITRFLRRKENDDAPKTANN